MILTVALRLHRRHALDDRLLVHRLRACCRRRPSARTSSASTSTSGCWPSHALADLDREPRRSTASSSLIFVFVIGFLLAVLHRPEDPLREHLPHHLPLSLRALLHRHRPRLAVDAESRLRRAERRCAASAGRASPSTRSTTADIVIYALVIAGALAGHRPDHVPDARRPARHRRGHLEGRARRRHPDVEDLPLHRHPDDAAGLHHHAGHRRRAASSSSTTWSSRMTGGGPGISSRGAGEIRLRLHVPGAEPRPGLRRLDDDAASPSRSSSSLGLSRIRQEEACLTRTLAAASPTPIALDRAEPRGARAARALSRRNDHPLRHADRRRALLPAAALRDGRDLAEGHARDPPRQHLLAAAGDHLRALGQGLGRRPAPASIATGLSRGFWNSVQITVPIVIAVDRHRARSTATRSPTGGSRAPRSSSPS